MQNQSLQLHKRFHQVKLDQQVHLRSVRQVQELQLHQVVIFKIQMLLQDLLQLKLIVLSMVANQVSTVYIINLDMGATSKSAPSASTAVSTA